MNEGDRLSDVTPTNPPDADPNAAAPSVIADVVHNATENLRNIDEQVRRLVVDRPAVALLAAVAAGFVVGRLASRL
jgi:hypothetical protein